jgi:hypothetical protein
MATTKKTTRRTTVPKKASGAKRSAGASAGIESPVYSKEGAKVGAVALPQNVFGLPWNADLVHRVVVSLQSNERARRFYESSGWQADGTTKTEQMGAATVRELRYVCPL